MFQKITFVVALVVSLFSAPAFAQGLFDTPEGGGGEVIIVTPEQLVDGILAQSAPHGCKPRYINRAEGMVIMECRWFPMMSRYRVTSIPPEAIISFPPYELMWGLAMTPRLEFYKGESVSEEMLKERKLQRMNSAKAVQLFSAGEKVRQEAQKKIKDKKKKVVIKNLEGQLDEDTDKGNAESVMDEKEVEKTLLSQNVPWNGLDWYTCQWANPQETINQGTALKNPAWDKDSPMVCLIKIAFSGTDKHKPVMAVTLASLSDIPDGLKWLTREYGIKAEDAKRFSTSAPMVRNSPILREGLLDTFQKMSKAQAESDEPGTVGAGATAIKVVWWICLLGNLVLWGLILFMALQWLALSLYNSSKLGPKSYALLVAAELALLAFMWKVEWAAWASFGVALAVIVIIQMVKKYSAENEAQVGEG